MEEVRVEDLEKMGNEQVQFTLQQKPGCHFEAKVVAEMGLCTLAKEKGWKRLRKELHVPRFRPGKAPLDLLESSYPKEMKKAWEEALGSLVLQEVIKISKLTPVLVRGKLNFGLSIQSLSIEKAEITVAFEAEPKVPSLPWDKLFIKEVKAPVVNATIVDETILQAQLFFAKWEDLGDGPVTEDCYVDLDIEDIEQTPPLMLFSEVRFSVVKEKMADWMYNLVLGRKKGEKIEGISTPDAKATEEEKNLLKDKKVAITIKKIQKAQVPALDDAFAQKLGVFSVQDLKEQTEKTLHKKAEAHVKEEQRKQVSELLLENLQFDVPESLVQEEAYQRLSQMMQDKEYQKEVWGKMTKEAQNSTFQSIVDISRKAVKMFFISREIVRLAGITISPEEIEKVPNTAFEQLLNAKEKEEELQMQKSQALSQLLLHKVEDWIIEKIKEKQV